MVVDYYSTVVKLLQISSIYVASVYLLNVVLQCYSPLQNWEQGLVGFYSAYQHPTTMCAWITSRGAKMMELTPVEEVAQRCVAHLRKMLPSKYQVPDAVVCKR